MLVFNGHFLKVASASTVLHHYHSATATRRTYYKLFQKILSLKFYKKPYNVIEIEQEG
jgi:hypothetical protein